MARSQKRGINYFTMDVDIFSDRKLRRVRHAFGAGAMTVVLSVLCHIYGEKGYYIEVGKDLYFDLSDELDLDEKYVRTVTESCVEAGFFDASLYSARGVLTSRRIQCNYLDATRKRKNVEILPELCLLECEESEDEEAGGDRADDAVAAEAGGIAAETGAAPAEDSAESTQSKVNKTKSNKRKPHNPGGSGRAVISPRQMVKLSGEERASLAAEFGEAALERMIEMLGSYKGASGKQYKSDYCAIKSWVVKRWREENARGPTAAHFAYERPPEDYDHLAVDLFADSG